MMKKFGVIVCLLALQCHARGINLCAHRADEANALLRRVIELSSVEQRRAATTRFHGRVTPDHFMGIDFSDPDDIINRLMLLDLDHPTRDCPGKNISRWYINYSPGDIKDRAYREVVPFRGPAPVLRAPAVRHDAPARAPGFRPVLLPVPGVERVVPAAPVDNEAEIDEIEEVIAEEMEEEIN